MKKKIMSALLLCVMVALFCVPAFAANTSDADASEPVVFKTTTLPEWFPEDAPAPDPNGEIVTVYWYAKIATPAPSARDLSTTFTH